ncbi:MAG: TolC family protein [Ferruginibacter sp.]
MLRNVFLFSILVCVHSSISAQRLVTRHEAVELSLNNQRNFKAADLNVQQQQQLLSGATGFDNPVIQLEASPYEPLVAGVQQSFNLPGVYRSRKALQNERIQLARLQLQGSQNDLKKEVRLSYTRLQYFTASLNLFRYQDSIYQAIKTASKRFFDAGQINKLEELQAASQADRIHNELVRIKMEQDAELQMFRFYTNLTDTFYVEQMEIYVSVFQTDSISNNIQQQIFEQQISIEQRQLTLQKAELLPGFTAGLLFPTTKTFERPVGYQVGISLPIYRKQNRSRIAAAQTGVEIARAEKELAAARLNARFLQALYNYRKEEQSLSYYSNTALPQARLIIETSQRLFQGGELNYIESLRNLQMAFATLNDHLETYRAYNEAAIELNYLNQTL